MNPTPTRIEIPASCLPRFEIPEALVQDCRCGEDHLVNALDDLVGHALENLKRAGDRSNWLVIAARPPGAAVAWLIRMPDDWQPVQEWGERGSFSP